MKRNVILLIALAFGLECSAQKIPIRKYLNDGGNYTIESMKIFYLEDTPVSNQCEKYLLLVTGEKDLNSLYKKVHTVDTTLNAGTYKNSCWDVPTGKIEFFLGKKFTGEVSVYENGYTKILLNKDNCQNVLGELEETGLSYEDMPYVPDSSEDVRNKKISGSNNSGNENISGSSEKIKAGKAYHNVPDSSEDVRNKKISGSNNSGNENISGSSEKIKAGKVYHIDTRNKKIYEYDTTAVCATNINNFYYYGDGINYTYYPRVVYPIFYSAWLSWDWYYYPSWRFFYREHYCSYHYDYNHYGYTGRGYGSLIHFPRQRGGPVGAGEGFEAGHSSGAPGHSAEPEGKPSNKTPGHDAIPSGNPTSNNGFSARRNGVTNTSTGSVRRARNTIETKNVSDIPKSKAYSGISSKNVENESSRRSSNVNKARGSYNQTSRRSSVVRARSNNVVSSNRNAANARSSNTQTARRSNQRVSSLYNQQTSRRSSSVTQQRSSSYTARNNSNSNFSRSRSNSSGARNGSGSFHRR